MVMKASYQTLLGVEDIYYYKHMRNPSILYNKYSKHLPGQRLSIIDAQLMSEVEGSGWKTWKMVICSGQVKHDS